MSFWRCWLFRRAPVSPMGFTPIANAHRATSSRTLPQSRFASKVIQLSLQIGGTNEIPNLFPQRATGVINSRTKDKIENYLKREVCGGNMELEEAQALIVEDWLAVWEDYEERGEE